MQLPLRAPLSPHCICMSSRVFLLLSSLLHVVVHHRPLPSYPLSSTPQCSYTSLSLYADFDEGTDSTHLQEESMYVRWLLHHKPGALRSCMQVGEQGSTLPPGLSASFTSKSLPLATHPMHGCRLLARGYFNADVEVLAGKRQVDFWLCHGG